MRLIAYLLFSSTLVAQNYTGTVIKVTDGDTVIVLEGTTKHRVRLIGIDAPERSQEFGPQATQYLSGLVLNQPVDVQANVNKDLYGREIGKLLIRGLDVNLQMIKGGYAWWFEAYKQSQSAMDQKNYKDATLVAQGAKSGLWTASKPQAPWEFRAAAKAKKVK